MTSVFRSQFWGVCSLELTHYIVILMQVPVSLWLWCSSDTTVDLRKEESHQPNPVWQPQPLTALKPRCNVPDPQVPSGSWEVAVFTLYWCLETDWQKNAKSFGTYMATSWRLQFSLSLSPITIHYLCYHHLPVSCPKPSLEIPSC